jgi:hypothetical protein
MLALLAHVNQHPAIPPQISGPDRPFRTATSLIH